MSTQWPGTCHGVGSSFSRLGAVLALLAGLLAVSGATTSPPAAATGDPIAPAAVVAPAAPTGNVMVDPDFAAGQAAGADTTALARQSDGMVLVAGWWATSSAGGYLGVKRFKADGVVDPAFDAALRFNGDVVSIAVQPDGKILVGGYFTTVGGQPRSGIARLTVNGNLDASFNPGSGFTNSAGEMVVHSIVVAPSGQVVAGGAFDSYRGVVRRGLVRLQATAALDSGFDPMITGTVGPVAIHALTLQPDGKILVGGLFSAVSLNMRNNFVRLNSNGTLDSTITGGWGFNAEVLTIAVQDDGKIVIGGAFDTFNTQAAKGLVRLQVNGYRDLGLRGGFTKDGERARVTAIVTSGWSVSTVTGDFTHCDGSEAVGIAGFTTNGAGTENYFDPGQFWSQVRPTERPGRQIGPLAVSGHRNPPAVLVIGRIDGRHSLDAMSARYFLPPDFRPQMLVHKGFDAPVASIVELSDGKSLVAGTFRHYNGTAVGTLVRLNADGTLDPGFDAQATVRGPATSLAALADGRVVVVWHDWPDSPAHEWRHQTVSRLMANGATDPSFAASSHYSQWSQSGIASLVVQPDGKLLIGGQFWGPQQLGIAPPSVARLNSDGSPDAAFTTVYFQPADRGSVNDMVVEPDGGIVVVGLFTEAGGTPVNGIVRLGPTGQPDPSFPVGSGFAPFLSQACAIVRQPDGKLVILGTFSLFDGVPRRGIVRLQPNGAIDLGFNPGKGFGGLWQGRPSAMALQDDGKLVVAGSFQTYNDTPRRGLLRLNGNGTVDPGFDPGGGVNFDTTFDLGAGGGPARVSMVLGQAGGLMLGGGFYGFDAAEPAPSGITRVVPPAPTVPGQPVILGVMPSAGSVDVGFTAPTNDGGVPVTTYEYSVDGGPWTARVPASVASPVRVGGLTDGQVYQLRLRAVNSVGAGGSAGPVGVRAGAPIGSVLVPVAPARVVDSRVTVGGPGPIAAGETRELSVASTQAGGASVVPAGAVAVAYNLTVPWPSGAGHVRVMPGDAPMLPTASAINFRAWETIANAAIVKISADRTVKVFNGAGVSVDVIIDVVGYFMPSVSGAAGTANQTAVANGSDGLFTPVTPVRVYDTASDPAGMLAGGQSRLVSTATTQNAAAPVVPAGATAVAYNITVVDTAGAGHLRVMPGDVLTSEASVINWARTGDRIANGSVVQVDAQQRIRVFNGSGAPVRFFVDVTGYYSASGKQFFAIDPVRTTETRYAFGGAGPVAPLAAGVRTVSTAASAAGGLPVVPVGASAVTFNATVTGTIVTGHLRVYPADVPLVDASLLNWRGGYTRANAASVGISADREVNLYNGSGVAIDVLIDINGYYK